jgi:arylsulfatase A-like enzyme/tetratricopeptide (TPR) repeat protein
MKRPRWTGSLAATLILVAAAVVFYIVIIRPARPRAGRVIRNPEANVLLITLDTTRPDRLGAYGYAKAETPEIDGLARSGALFENAYSPVPMTLPAHASIMTGAYPLFHGVHLNGKFVLGPGAVTLAKTLKSVGYATAAFVSCFILDSRFGLNQGFEYYGDRMEDAGQVKNLDSERRAETTFRDFESWMERRRGAGKFFAWVHFYDPHYPYVPPEPYRSDPRLAGPYDGEISYMDHYIGEVRRLLEAKGLADSTLIILAGDHGEAFGEHGEIEGHTIFAYEENIRVPLIFWSARGFPKGRRVRARASLVDIFPTVLDYLRLKAPAFVQGKSLVPLLEGRRQPARDFYFETDYFRDVLGCSPLRGVISAGFKYIDLPRPELYDLARDPAEKANLADSVSAHGAGSESEPSRLKNLRATLASLEKTLSGSGLLSGKTMTAQERRRLESLGYLAGAAKPSSGPVCDPKDKIGFWNRSLEAQKLLKANKLDEAEALLYSLFDEDPRFVPVIEDLAGLLFARKRADDLQRLFERAIAQNPESAALRISYGGYLVRLNRGAEAIAELRAAEAMAGPEEKELLYFTMASACGRLEKFDEAVSFFRKVLDLEPENFEAARLLGYTLMRLRRFDEALKAFQAAEKGIPDDPRLLEDTAMTCAELRDFESAKKYFERTVAIRPSAVIYANYALACAETGDYARAVELMRTAIACPDADPDLRALGNRKLAEWAGKH